MTSAALVAGCFQPLYGERSLTGGPAVRESLSAVDVMQIPATPASIESRLAVALRNELQFNFTGGGEPRPQTHRLKIQMAGTRSTIALDSNTALPSMENYILSASYSLIEVGTGKVVVSGRAFSTVGYLPPGQQRFARISNLEDVERRAAKVVADDITTRVASYFISGT